MMTANMIYEFTPFDDKTTDTYRRRKRRFPVRAYLPLPAALPALSNSLFRPRNSLLCR